MRRRQCPQQIFGLGRQVQHEFAAIALGGFAGQQSQSRKPLRQLRYGVRPQNQALREIADGGFAARYAAGSGAASSPKVITRDGAFTADLVVSPDGTRFLQQASDEVWLRDVSDGAVRAIIPATLVEQLAFGSDGRFAIAAHDVVRVFDADARLLWSRDPRMP